MAVIIVILMVFFLGGAAAGGESALDLLAYGVGIALVIVAGSVAVLIFQRVHQREIGHEHVVAHREAGVKHPED